MVANAVDLYIHDGEHGYYTWSPTVPLGTIDPTAWTWVKVRKRGELVSAKFWQDGDAEPDVWLIEDFDTADPSYDGGGLLHQWMNVLEFYFDHTTNAKLWIQEIRATLNPAT